MKVGGRNQIAGVVPGVHSGALNTAIKVDIGDCQIVTASIANEVHRRHQTGSV